MIVYCTGSSKGLGLALKEKYKTLNAKFTGLNRPQYDLSRSVLSFVRTDFDIFINNAYYNFAQVELLYKLFEENRDRDCMIVNISSVSADKLHNYINPYAIHKAALDRACLQLQEIDSCCRVVNFKLGRMNTEMVKDKPNPKLDPIIIAEQIVNLSNLPYNVAPKTITLDNVFLPKK
jgi:NAD(P)-dependent dehydrogenase (short-subunit alcohol dehydrogenase family)